MGINIILSKGGEDHPEWDYFRQGSDRLFPHLIDWGNTEARGFSSYYDRDDYFRPTDIDALKERLIAQKWEDEDRYMHLISLLEKDEDCWLYFSC